MAGKHSEVSRTHPSVPRKDAITMEEVISDIANKEQGRKACCSDHESLVSCDFAATNAQIRAIRYRAKRFTS